MGMKDRAQTDEQKREVIEALLAAWLSVPSMRLCQLIENAKPEALADTYYIEDLALVRLVHEFVGRCDDV